MVGNFELAKSLGAAVADTVGIKLRTEILRLKPENIEPDPDQPRQEFGADGLARLAASLRTHGQIHPVVVRREMGRYILVSGERRWRAAKLAGMPFIDAVFCKSGDVRAIQLLENVLREDLKPVEQAKAYQAIMVKEGWTARELSRRLNLEHSGVAKALKLLKLDPEVQEAVDDGKIPHTTAYEIAKKPKEQQVPLARAAAAGKLKGADLRQRPTSPPAPKALTSAPDAPPRPALTLGGGAVDVWTFSSGKVRVDVTGHRDEETLIAALEKALDAALDGKASLAGGTGRTGKR